MRERLTPGIHVAEEVGAGEAIARVATTTVAFVGRALRGPVNHAIAVSSFADFQAVFGGLWQPSTLSYAVEQFFENGGRLARIVRVVNGGRPATLTLPATKLSALTLEAQCAGTREFLRAAVDYDNLDASDTDKFNLVVQRVRAPGSEYVEDQEIYPRLSIDPNSPRQVAAVLAESALIRLKGAVPLERPVQTHGAGRTLAAYVSSNPDGDDGGPLTDYDIIGSAIDRTGLFALGDDDPFNFLCVPPLTRDHAVGPSALLVAARFCRDRRGLLLLDPPTDWQDPAAALEGIRRFAFASENALMYFPSIQAYDRLRGRFETFAPSAAAAGMLARLDATRPFWTPQELDDGPLRPGLRPACAVSEDWRTRLAAAGITTLQAVRPRRSIGARTLAASRATAPDWRYLGLRRLALLAVDSIERGTRWVLFEQPGPALWWRIERQVAEFLTALERDQAFPSRPPDRSWFAICDQRVNPPRQIGEVHVLFGFAALREAEWHCWLVTHGPAGSRAQPVSLNRLQSAGGKPPLDPDFDVATVLQEHLTR